MQGTLETFGVVDVLQMLGRTRLSGTLHIECPERVIDVHFVRGRIAETRDSTRGVIGAAIGRLLVERGLVGEHELSAALAAQEGNPRPLGTLLVERGALAESALRDVLSRQIANTLVAARLEAMGDFLFMTDHDPIETGFLTIDTQSVLLEISSLGEEYISAVEMLGHYDTVVVRNGYQPLGPSITSNDQDVTTVLAHVDGRRAVRDLIAQTRLEEVSVISILGRLVASGALLVKVGLQTRPETDLVLQAHRDTVLAEVSRLLEVDAAERAAHAAFI